MRNAATERLLSVASSTGLSITEDAFAVHLDKADPLQGYRSQYYFPKKRGGEDCVYLSSNMFGLQHVEVEPVLQSLMKKWRDQGVEGYRLPPSPWVEMEQAYCKDVAGLVGASTNEIAIMNPHTVNVHFIPSAFYHHKGSRKKILIEKQASVGDFHCSIPQLEMQGFNPAEDLVTFTAADPESGPSARCLLTTETILSLIAKHADDAMMLLLPAIDPLSGCFFDIEAIVKAAHASNIVVGLDCVDAVGNVPLRLHEWNVDFGFWYGYKYLGGGPGSVGATFLHTMHTMPGSEITYLREWWAHESRSDLSWFDSSTLAEGAGVLPMCFTPTLSLAVLGPSLKGMATVGMEALRNKSLQLTAYMELLINELVPTGCIDMITPADPARRGAQLSIRVLSGKLKLASESTVDVDACDASIMRTQLLDAGVVVDYMAPDIIRLTLVPMYNTYADMLYAACAISAMF